MSQVVQRTFINLDFEGTPYNVDEPNRTCVINLLASSMPGWQTSHSNFNAGGPCGPAGNAGSFGPVIEVWRNGGTEESVTSHSGRMHIELNANEASRVSQSVCLIPGETINYSFAHRFRSGDGNASAARFLIGAQNIINFRTVSPGTGTITATVLGTASQRAASNGWVVYSGSFVNSIADGSTNIGFEANGSRTYGNFLDTVDVELAPFLNFEATSFDSREGASNGTPSLQVAGVLKQQKRVYFQIVAGSATLDDVTFDPTIATLVAGSTDRYYITLPAGDYTAGRAVDLGMRGIADGSTEPNEAVAIRLLDSPDPNAGYHIENTQICGGIANREITWTIRDASPGLKVDKTATLVDGNGNGYPDIGDTVTYDLTVTNIGNEDLSNVVIVDPLLGARPAFNIGALAVDASSTVSVPGIAVNMAHILAGEVTNSAYATGTSTSGPVTAPTVSANIPLTLTPAITIEKSGRHDDLSAGTARVGHSVYYTFRVTNTGNVRLSTVRVQDDLIDFNAIVATTLEPGASVEVTTTTAQSHTLTQLDLYAGEVLNTASVTARPVTGGPDVTDEDDAAVKLLTQTGLALTKTAVAPTGGSRTVDYTFVIRNTGTVRLRDVTVADPMITSGFSCGAFAYPVPTLDPGQTVTCTAVYSLTEEDLRRPQVSNTARAIGATLSDVPVTSEPSTATFARPLVGALTLVKVADASAVATPAVVGQQIAYSFTLKNTGSAVLRDIRVTDPLLGGTLSGIVPSLLPGDSITLPGGPYRYSLLQADLYRGEVENTAVATGTYTDGSGVPRSATDISGSTGTTDDPVVVPLTQSASVTLVKLPDATAVSSPAVVGEEIIYSFTLTNTGSVTLTNVTVDDPMLGGVLSGTIASLAPGDSLPLPGGPYTYALTQADLDLGEVENTAVATGTYTDGSGTPQSATDISGSTGTTDDPVVVPLTQSASVTLVKTVDASAVSSPAVAGDELVYSFTLTNTGSVTLTNVTVDDPMLGGTLSGTIPSLLPGDSVILPGGPYPYALTQADLERGRVDNTAVANATYTDGTGVPKFASDISGNEDTTDDATVVVIEQSASLAIVKTADVERVTEPRDVTYTITVTNTGAASFAAADVTVEDRLTTALGTSDLAVPAAETAGDVNGNGRLDASESWTYKVVYPVTQRDIDAGGELSNVALVSVTTGSHSVPPVTSPPVIVRIEATPATLSVEKLAGVETAMVGDLVPYTIRMTNAGGVSVTGNLLDTLPAGFIYREGSARLDGAAVTPVVRGGRIALSPVTINPGAAKVLTMQVLVGSSVRPGSHTNRVLVTNTATGEALAPEATATVRVLADAVLQCSTVLGRVFDDADQNGDMSKHAEERGLPNVRLVAPNGLAIVTDEHGRFNVPCAAMPRAIGSNFMLKVDERTLPSGYRMTTENPRVVRLTPGMITRMDFGATMARLVRIDLAANAFAQDDRQNDLLVPQLTKGLETLVAEIRDTATMLRITYVQAPNETEDLAQARLELVETAVRKLWAREGKYKLNIETLVQGAGAVE